MGDWMLEMVARQAVGEGRGALGMAWDEGPPGSPNSGRGSRSTRVNTRSNYLSLHQREHAPAQILTRISDVAHGFRDQLSSNLFG